MSDEEDEISAYLDNERQGEDLIRSVPTIEYWQKMYGKSLEGNDQKAVRVFRDYEPAEKVRRFQHELMQVKDRKVSDTVLRNVLGRKRQSKFNGFHHWAERMLLWIAAKKA